MEENIEFEDLDSVLINNMAELALIKTEEIFMVENETEASIEEDELNDSVVESGRSLRRRADSDSSLHRTRNRKVRKIPNSSSRIIFIKMLNRFQNRKKIIHRLSSKLRRK